MKSIIEDDTLFDFCKNVSGDVDIFHLIGKDYCSVSVGVYSKEYDISMWKCLTRKEAEVLVDALTLCYDLERD